VDGGNQWSDLSSSLPSSSDPISSFVYIYSLVVDPTDAQTVYIATGGDGVFRSTDGGRSWAPRNQGIEFQYINELVIAPKLPQTLYALCSWCYTGSPFSLLYKTSNGGETWERLAFPPLTVPYLIVLDPTDSQIVYVAAAVQGTSTVEGYYAFLVSTDGGQTWVTFRVDNLGGQITSLTPAPSTPHLLYANTNGGLFKSTDGGATWTLVIARSFAAFVVDPSDSNTLYASNYTPDVFKSSDGGYTWTSLNEGLPSVSVRALVIDPMNPRVLYAGTEGAGVFHLEQRGPISLTSINPNSGPTKGGTVVTISGENVLPGATVTIGGSLALNVTVVNATTITASTPPGSAGTANVIVINPGCMGELTCSATLANAFTYVVPPLPNVVFAPSALDFGVVKVGKQRQLSVTVRNTGPERQTLQFATALPFRLRSTATVRVKAGKRTKVKVQFVPPSAGMFSGVVVVTNPTVEGNLEVPVRGVGISR
jgi:photosystem II stability/assembly factor-like uncharacterized protein